MPQMAWVSSIWSWSQLGDKMPAWESACRLRACGPQWHTVEQPQPRWGRSAAMVRRTLGQYVAVCPRLQLTSHTQPTSTLSRIKCQRYIFIKKCVRSFIEFVIMFDYVLHIFVYVYVCGYGCGYTTLGFSVTHIHTNFIIQIFSLDKECFWGYPNLPYHRVKFLSPSGNYIVVNYAFISSRIRLCYTFIWEAFKSHTRRSNAQCVNAPTTTILPTTAGTFRTDAVTWYTRCKLTRSKILQNVWVTLVFSTSANYRRQSK